MGAAFRDGVCDLTRNQALVQRFDNGEAILSVIPGSMLRTAPE
jgi:hypothetical protein